MQNKHLTEWATLLTTKIRFANVTPRIFNGVNSGGRSLLRGKVSWGELVLSVGSPVNIHRVVWNTREIKWCLC